MARNLISIKKYPPQYPSNAFLVSLHKMISCDALMLERDIFWCDLINIGPIEFSAYLHGLSDTDFLACILFCRTEFDLNDVEVIAFRKACIINVYKMCATA